MTRRRANTAVQQRYVRDWAPLIFLAGGVLLFFWPVWVAGFTFPQGGGDLFGQLQHVWTYVAGWVRKGVFPLWSTRMMAGDPIVAEAQYGLFNPLNWPLFLAPSISRDILLLRVAVTLWLAGSGMYLYLRRSPVWRRSRSAALAAGVAYMLSNPFITHLGHPQFNDVMAWLPWVLWGLDGATRRKRAIPLAGLALAALLLAGHGQAALYAILVISAYSLWQVLEGGPRAPRRIGRLALVALLAAALAAPSILPGMERLPQSERSLASPEARRGYEFPPAMLVDFLNPNFHGQGVNEFWPGWDRVESGYAGAATLCLAAVGLWCDRRRRRTWFLLLLGGFVYLFALGYGGPLYEHLAALPFFTETWKTSRIIYLLSFVISVAAALGVDALKRSPSIRVWMLLALIAAGVLWVGAPAWSQAAPAGIHQQRALNGLRVTALALAATAGLGWLVSLHAFGARAGLLLLLAGEMITAQALADLDPPANHDNPHTGALEFLQADPGWFRVDVDVAAIGLWSPGALMAEGMDVPQGTGNPMELFRYNQFYWAVPTKGSPAYQILGAKYIVVPKGAQPGGAGIWPVYLDDPLIDLHLNTNSLPRAWLVYQTAPVTSIEETYAIIFASDFAPAQVATVLNGPALSSQGQGAIEVLAYGPNQVKLRVETSQTALLVLSDLLYSGWTATLDGARTPIYTTNGIFRGIEVPAGSHIIAMRFFPASLKIGLGMMISAVIIVALAASLERRRLRRIGVTSPAG